MIVRAPQDPAEGFTVLRNQILNDRRLSWKARGLLAHLLSKPPLWRTSSLRLAQSGPDGRDAVRTGLQELRDAGYIHQQRIQDRVSGRWRTISTVYDRPCAQPVDDHVDNEATEAGLSGAGKPGSSVNTEPVNTEVLNSLLTTRGTCSSCSGAGWLHYAGEVERCPECEASR